MPTSDIAYLRSRATQHTTPCGDGHTVWHVWGPSVTTGNQPPVLLLHGGSGSWTHWVRNIQNLVDTGRQVWVPDLPGFGDSALPTSGSDADALPTPLEAGLQQLIGDTAVDVVGFSFGGMVGAFLAQSYPARAARLVLVGAPALGMVERNTVPLKAWRHLADPAARELRHRHNLTALMLFDPAGVDADTLAMHIANVVRDRIPGRRLSYTDVLSRALQQVRCPVWAIYGREDALYLGRLPDLAAALQAAPTFQSLQLVDAAGHWVQYERAEVFNAALRTALGG
ncbi:MAG: alpha/beta hydrolase [Rhodoferax sp.]|uniref:alpha/beta fold hydrolase n=1 Tax=Rhodoferax sp. TaxID=50421 RepID=UPI0032637FEA